MWNQKISLQVDPPSELPHTPPPPLAVVVVGSVASILEPSAEEVMLDHFWAAGRARGQGMYEGMGDNDVTGCRGPK